MADDGTRPAAALDGEFLLRAHDALGSMMRLADEADRLRVEIGDLDQQLTGWAEHVGLDDDAHSALHDQTGLGLAHSVAVHTAWLLTRLTAAANQPLWDYEAAQLACCYGWHAPMPGDRQHPVFT